MSRRPCLIGIAGASCSGKTLLARRLAALVPGKAQVVSTDWYYRDLSHLDPDERTRWNFDAPEALDKDLFVNQLRALVQRAAVARPEYDFSTHTRKAQPTRMDPGDWIIVEGLFALYWEEIRALLDVKVFMDVDEETGLARRIARDVRERGRTEVSVRGQYAETVHPMYERYCLPTARFADVIARGNDPIDVSADTVLARLLPRMPMT